MENTTMTTTTERRGFSGVYDAAGHKADVIALLQGGRTGDELIYNRKLTPDEAAAIRSEYRFGEAGHSTYALAERYGVAVGAIWQIVNGQAYKTAVA